MKLLKFTRYSEWWEYKIVPLLSVGYATLFLADVPFSYKLCLSLGLIISSIIIGAIYVSVINDITDVAEDQKAGKFNRMTKVNMPVRLLIIFFCLSCGFFYSYIFYPDWLGILFYAGAWLVFSAYSIPPIRLKKRGISGVLCDAMGAHLFPALLMTTHLIYLNNIGNISYLWYWAIGSWSFFYGLRGILWHQFFDRSNDLQSGTTTYATRIAPENFKPNEWLIFGLELISFSLILSYVLNIYILIALVLYIILVVLRKKKLNYQISLIITPSSMPHQLLMNDFYLVFFPLALLISYSLTNNCAWILLLSHLLLFPKKTLIVIKDLIHSLRQYYK